MDGEGQFGTLLILFGVGMFWIGISQNAYLLTLFLVFAFLAGLIITWDDWRNKQRWMNRFFRKIATLIGKNNLE